MAPALWIVGMLLAHALVSVSAPVLAQQQAAVLDFEYFRTEVQQILSTKREGYTRCVVCHSADNAVGFLQPLAPGATTWDTEQSRENFDRVSALVMPGEPMKSQRPEVTSSITAAGSSRPRTTRRFRRSRPGYVDSRPRARHSNSGIYRWLEENHRDDST